MGNDEDYGNKIAPEGQVFVCTACGKRSKDLYGSQKIDWMWDESCVLNCVLCYESHLVMTKSGRVIEVKDGGIVE